MSRKANSPGRSLGAWMRRLWEDFLYYGLFLGAKVVSLLPFGVLYVVSDALYYPLYYVLRYRRRIVRQNLVESFPDKSEREIAGIERRFYRFFVDMMLESVKLLSAKKADIDAHIRYVNIDLPNRLLREGRSVGVFLGHYANWEWLSTASLYSTKEADVALIYHKLRNKAMDRLMKKLRERAGSVCISMHETARFMAGAKSEGKPLMIGFIADQSPRKREVRYFLGFLNHNVPVLTGTERAVKHFGYEALFISMRRVRRGYYECTFHTLHPNPQSLPDYELTRLYYRRLEQEITASPELYLWTHRRFKHAEKNPPTLLQEVTEKQ